jgi:hypothetical protein
VTVSCVWFHLLGSQPLVLWQLKQLVLPTGTCVTGLPMAVLPLWQLAQLVRVEGRVVDVGRPAAGALVAALAVAGDAGVRLVVRLAHRAQVAAGVAAAQWLLTLA